MALEKAGINLTLQGEAQYVAGLRNINRETELMALNTKLAVAQLGTGASPTQRYSTQMRHLGAEIEKASTKTMILRNRNRELPDQMFKTGKSLDVLKDAYEKQVKVQETLQKKKEEVIQTYGYGTQEFYKSRDALNEQNEVTAAAKEEVDKLEKSYNSMLDEYERMPNSMTAAQIATQNLINEQAKLREEYLNSGGVLAGFADKLDSGAEKLGRYGRNISDLGDSFMGVTAAIIAGGGGALKVYMDWETAFQGTKKTVDEMTESVDGVTYTYEELERGLRDLSLEIPIASSELAEMGEIAGRLQIPANEVVNFTEVMAKMAVTTDLSSQEAAESFGQFLNITGSGTGTVLNLANAIVELGNNTAAIESDIIKMSTRWASTGKIIGMTDEQIVGTSATLLALGVRAEAGGSSLQRAFQKINDAVLDGSDKLVGFAEVSQMTASEFSESWRNDPVEALVPFLKGLNDVHEEGGNVNGIMRDLGITSVNELNAILVLAQGYDQLADNVGMAGDAYHETNEAQMALNEEARVAFDTTANKLVLAWSRVKDQMIDIGEPIADALLDMVDAAEPVFETIERMAKGFTDLDATAQRDLIATVAKIALIAPALKLAGGAMTGLSNVFTLGASVVRGTGKVITKAMFAVSGEATTLTAVASTASGAGGVGGLVTAIGTTLPWALGIGAAALGGWTLWKTWGEDAWEASQQTKKWGRVVDEETEEALIDFQKLSVGVQQSTVNMIDNAEEGGQEILGSYEEMMELVVETADEKLGEINEHYEGLTSSAQHLLKETTDEHSKELEKIKVNAAEKYDEINQIYSKAIEENRNLTSEEMKRVEKLHNDLAKLQAEATGGTAEQIRQTQKTLMGDLEAMSREQLLKRRQYLQEDLEALKESHAKELEIIDERVAEGRMKFEEGEEAKLAIRQAYAREVQQIMDEEIKALKASGYEEQEMIDMLIGEYSKYGYERTDIERKIQEVIRGTQDEAYELDLMWKRMLEDPITGEVNTNLPDVMADMHESDESWQQLNYMIKEANLTSNQLEIIDEALVVAGIWDDIDPEVKELLSSNRVFMHKLGQSEEALNRWNNLPDEEKMILGNNTDIALEIMESEQMYNAWLSLPEEDKLLLGNNFDLLNKIIGSEKEYNRWLNLPEREKRILANNSQLFRAVDAAQRKLDNMRDKQVTLTTRNLTIYESIRRAGTSTSSNNFIQAGGRVLHDARGTNFHPGGLAMVNDQQGATFRELITLPDGTSFVPTGRDVLLDLPKGSQVLRAALTRMKMPNLPQYARGVGSQSVAPRSETIDSSSNDVYNVYITANGDLPDSTIRSMATKIEREIKNANDRRRSSKGERVSFG